MVNRKYIYSSIKVCNIFSLNNIALLVKIGYNNIDIFFRRCGIMQMEGSYVLAVVLTGLIVVFLALVVLIAFVWVMGKIFDAIKGNKSKKIEDGKKAETAVVKAPQPAAPAMKIEDGISDEIVAVIAAAVASMSGNFAIKSVRKASPKTSRRSAWGTQGIAESTRVF